MANVLNGVENAENFKQLSRVTNVTDGRAIAYNERSLKISELLQERAGQV